MRVDGRTCEDYRHMELETDVVSNAAGSARLRLVVPVFQSFIIVFLFVSSFNIAILC